MNAAFMNCLFKIVCSYAVHAWFKSLEDFTGRSHFVEVLEAVGAEEHERKKEEVVRGVDEDAGSERAGGQAGPAEDQADTDQQQKWTERPGGLFGVHQGEGNAGCY